jgi:peptidoglycan/xylan/chitin deacetylase (PgdA/CDA1 family)
MSNINLKKFTLSFMYKAGAFDVVHSLRPHRLTVLNYHRINDVKNPNFDNFHPNVSASPVQFSRQMDYLKDRFNFITVEEIIDWLKGETVLPKYPALITFDDGYRDNLTNAYPILKERNIPAVIFVSTDYMDSNKPFYWDLISYCFHHSTKRDVTLPFFGNSTIANKQAAAKLAEQFIVKLKTLPEEEKLKVIDEIPEILTVDIPEHAFRNNHLTWDEIRYLANNGISIGSHTQSHPILTRISRDAARRELEGSKSRLETELGKEVTSFAYPNGSRDDFDPETVQIVKSCGYDIGFSLISGSPNISKLNPIRYEINRIYIGKNDTMPRFAAKLSGLRY